MTTWVEVSDSSSSWSKTVSRYVLEGYIASQARYVLDGSSPITWSDEQDSSSVWSSANSAATSWSPASGASTTWTAA